MGGGHLICPAGGSSTPRVGMGLIGLLAVAQLRAARPRPSPRPERVLRSPEERPSGWEAQQLTVEEGTGRELKRSRGRQRLLDGALMCLCTWVLAVRVP